MQLESDRAKEERKFVDNFKKSDIFLRVFLTNTLGFSSLKNIINNFLRVPIGDLRNDIEKIIAYTMKMMFISDLKTAYNIAKSLTDKELVKFVAGVNPLFKNKHNWGLRHSDIKQVLKTYNKKRGRKSKKELINFNIFD